MENFFPQVDLPTGLAQERLKLLSQQQSPWAALAHAVAGMAQSAQGKSEAMDQQKQKFQQNNVESSFMLGQGAVKQPGPGQAPLPRYIQMPLAEKMYAEKTAAENVSGRAAAAQSIEEAKAGHAKEIEELKAGHAKELATQKEASQSAIKAYQESQKQELAKLQSSLKTGDAAAIKTAADAYNKSLASSPFKSMLDKAGLVSAPKVDKPSEQSAPDGKVWVRNKDGQRGHIPKAQLKEALADGYTQE